MTEHAPATSLIEDADRARLALSPMRRRLLEALREPGSAMSLAHALGLPRQRIGYHLRALEAAGLVRLVEERRRRGFTERVLVACADAFVVDPGILGRAPQVHAQDRFAAEHLVAVAADVVREVTRMRGAAEAEGKRLLTFTIEADLGFDSPRDLEDFTHRLTDAVADLVARHPACHPAHPAHPAHHPSGRPRRRYRLVIGAHPAVADRPPTPRH